MYDWFIFIIDRSMSNNLYKAKRWGRNQRESWIDKRGINGTLSAYDYISIEI